MRIPILTVSLSLAILTAGCATMGYSGSPASPLTNTDGIQIGTVRAWNAPGGLAVEVVASGLTPGPHGIHVHATGRCDRPFFTTAGAHWNPANRAHGHANPKGPHLGDGGNLVAGPDGRARATLMLAGATREALKDWDGAAVVIHAKADDERTDPSGNSGDRIACALIR